jgi:phage terminase large subunit
MDEGYTNPAVILLVGIDGDERLHIAREYYERGKLQKDVVQTARTWGLGERKAELIAVDAAAAGLIADLRDVGLSAQAAKGRVLDGIANVQARLKVQGDGKPRLTVDPACVNVINEFESYVWKPEKDEPVKENDHAMDALRYLDFAFSRGHVEVVSDPFSDW